MARIEMSRDFDWKVPGTKSHTLIALKAGQTYTVKRECCDAAVKAGAGKEVGATLREPVSQSQDAPSRRVAS